MTFTIAPRIVLGDTRATQQILVVALALFTVLALYTTSSKLIVRTIPPGMQLQKNIKSAFPPIFGHPRTSLKSAGGLSKD